MNFFKKAKKGFTLVELVVVIAVIAILGAVSVGAYFGITESANHSRSEQEARQAYTQLQSKTLSGLDLGNSGTKVSLTSGGLAFDGIYDNVTLNELNSLVFNEGTEFEVISSNTAIAEDLELSASPRVFFLAINDNGPVAKYMGYVPANISSKYVKYIELGNGELVTTLPTLDFKSEILPSGWVKDDIRLSNFPNVQNNSSYYDAGTYVSNSTAEYKGFLSSAKNIIDEDVIQIKKDKVNGLTTGIYTTKSVGTIKKVYVSWADNSNNTEDDVLTVFGTSVYAYEDSFNPHDKEKFEFDIPYGTNYLDIEDLMCFARFSSTHNALYLDQISVYYDTTNGVPDLPLELNLSRENVLQSTFDNIEITADIDVEWTNSDDSVATIEVEGNKVIVKSNNVFGKTTITAKSVLNTDLEKVCTIEYRELTSYTAGLVTNVSELSNNDKVVLVSNKGTHFMGFETKIGSNYYYTGNSVETNAHATLNSFSFDFDSFADAEILTIENHEENSNTFSFKKANGKYIAVRNANNTLGEGDLYKANTNPAQIYDSAVFTLSFNGKDEALLLNKDENSKVISLNTVENTPVFGTSEASKDNGVFIYKLSHTSAAQLRDIKINSENLNLKPNDTVTLSADAVPYMASLTGTTTWESSEPSLVSVVDGVVTAIAETPNPVTITAKNGTFEDSITVSVFDINNHNYLITDVNELQFGDKIAIVAKDYNKALSTTQNNNNRGLANITKEENFLNIPQNNVEIITLEENINKEGTFSLKTLSGQYLYASSNSENHLKSTTNVTANSAWKIEIASDGTASIVAQGGNARNVLKFNNSSSIFSCYAANNTMQDVVIYKINTIDFSMVYGIDVNVGNENITAGNSTDITVNLKNYLNEVISGKTIDVTVDKDASTYELTSNENVYTFSSSTEGTYKITFSVTDGGRTISKDVEIKVNAANDDPAKTDVKLTMDRALTGVSGTNYTSWSNKNVADPTDSTISFTASGQSAGGNSSIQLRSSSSNSGIIVKFNGCRVKKVIVVWNFNTSDGRVLNIYKNTKEYTAPTELYNASTDGDQVGTIEKGTSTEYSFTEPQTYIGLRSKSGAMYITSITFVVDQVK